MEEKKNLTAKEARELSESSHFLKNQSYKQIKEGAKFNLLHTDVCIEGMSKKVVEEVVEDLKENGYVVNYQDNHHVLSISWE